MNPSLRRFARCFTVDVALLKVDSNLKLLFIVFPASKKRERESEKQVFSIPRSNKAIYIDDTVASSPFECEFVNAAKVFRKSEFIPFIFQVSSLTGFGVS